MASFTVYPVQCHICGKKMQAASFNLIVGAWAMFLCPKHLKEVTKLVEKLEGRDELQTTPKKVE